jgi:hypothetical protein
MKHKNRIKRFFSFPNPVNAVASRLVAATVVLLSAIFLATGWSWLLVVIAYGFWARLLTGPKLSLAGFLSSKVIAPKIARPQLSPGPPKRFAQGIGTLFSSLAVIFWFGFSQMLVAKIVIGFLTAAAFLEAGFGICLGCIMFGQLMKFKIIPESVCESCNNLNLSISRNQTFTAADPH